MKRLIRSLPVVLLAAGAALPAAAQCPFDTGSTTNRTCYVATTGNDANAGTRTSPMKTIQAAIDLAAGSTAFQTVRVLAGTYAECPTAFFVDNLGNPVSSDLDIVADDFLANNRNTTTIIDGTTVCGPTTAVVGPTVTLGNNGRLRGFTVKGGGDSGVAGYGFVVISKNVITGNEAQFVGGGVYSYTGSYAQVIPEPAPDPPLTGIAKASIDNNSITANKAPFGGGGVYVSAIGAGGVTSDVIVTTNTISGNTAGEGNSSYDTFGAGLSVFTNTGSPADVSTVAITANVIDGNIATAPAGFATYGGGLVAATLGEGTEHIDVNGANAVRNNQATSGYGGGISALLQPASGGDHRINVASNTVSANTAGLGGGGLYLLTLAQDLAPGTTADLIAQSNLVSGNSTSGLGGDFGVTGGGGVYAEFFNERSLTGTPTNVVTLQILGNDIRLNSSRSLGGGAALYCRSYAEIDSDPGTIQPTASTLRFANNLVVKNNALRTAGDPVPADGGGIYALALALGNASSAQSVLFNTIAENHVDPGGAGGVALDGISLLDSASNEGTAGLDASDSIYLKNDEFAVGGPIVPGVGGVTARIAYNDAWLNTAAGGPYAPALDPIATSGPGNLAVDPKVDATYIPALCSATIDAADPALGTFLAQGGLQDEPQPNGRIANMGHTGLSSNAVITLPDANGDGVVDGVDILRVALSFASASSNPNRYIAGADTDKDGDVQGDDLAYMAAWYGKVCP